MQFKILYNRSVTSADFCYARYTMKFSTTLKPLTGQMKNFDYLSTIKCNAEYSLDYNMNNNEKQTENQ